HLRQMLTFLNVLTLQQPEAYIGNIEQSLDANGEVSADSLQNFLLAFQDAFTKWVRLIAKA
ncbi:MAG: NADPH-dependent FMN reductase, partial [Eubacteriales bacterium]|nr:NADPH-dependent FMN reductase [Eubacteriales bacterium]